MEFKKLINERFSCKKFSTRKVEEEKLQAILEAGNLAPTAVNAQPYRVYVLESPEALAKLDALTPCRYNAPTVLLLVYEEKEEWKNPLQEGIHSGVEDVSIIATHMMLAAKDEGIDSCWINYFGNDALEQAFGLPSTEHSVLLLDLGYSDNFAPLPKHTQKKPLGEIVKRI